MYVCMYVRTYVQKVGHGYEKNTCEGISGSLSGASVEQLYLKGEMRGRGMHPCHCVVSAVAYLLTSDDPLHVSIIEHLRWKSEALCSRKPKRSLRR